MVTATLDAPRWVGPIVAARLDRDRFDDGDVLVRFYDNACMPVPPEAPDVVQATCINGEVTVPTVTPKVTGFVTYTLDPPGPYDPGTDGLHGDGDSDVVR